MSIWKIKVRLKCSTCLGEPEDGICYACNGSGYNTQEIDPKDIEMFSDRPPAKEFRCVCGKPESILRPHLGQIPHSWMQWGDNLVCGDCKSKVLLSCAMAAAEKVQQIKESKQGDSQ